MRIKTTFFLIILFITFLADSKSVFILIHGTWGADSSWYMPQGDFFDALEEVVEKKDSAVVPFRWSGGCGHESRVKAAHNLVKLINTYDTKTAIYIIGHSHGGNVATIASQLLAQEGNRFRIRALFTLGTPVMSNYYPNMSVIYYLYNLISFEDLVQTVLGISDREFPSHRRLANMQVYINGVQPDHSGLHHPLMGKWIAYLHKYYKSFLEQNGIMHRISDPSIMYLAHDKEPEFKLDDKRQELLDRDRRLSMMMLNALRNTHSKSHYSSSCFLGNSLDTESSIPLINL